ncbi:MAG: hypothetical protein ACYDC6_08935 [Acidobacteriaceae bacterium]
MRDAPSKNAIIGRYILTSRIFELLDKTPLDAGIDISRAARGCGSLRHRKLPTHEGPVRDYLGDVLPGLANTSIRRLAELIPTAWAANHR